MAVAIERGIIGDLQFEVGARFELIEALEGHSWFEAKLLIGPKDYKTGRVASNRLELTPEEIREFDLNLDSQNALIYKDLEVEYIGVDKTFRKETMKKGDLFIVMGFTYEEEGLFVMAKARNSAPNSDGVVQFLPTDIKRRS